MTAIRPERLAIEPHADRSGHDGLSVAKAVESEIREFVRRDVSYLRRPRPEPVQDTTVENVNLLIRQVSGASMEEIDRVILELQGVREMLRNEGQRVIRELAGFASLSHAAITSMKIIADSVAQWKNPAQAR